MSLQTYNMESPTQSTPAWLFSLLAPAVMIIVQAGFFTITCLLNPHLLLSAQFSRLQTKSFALFWARLGKAIANDFPSPQLDDIITSRCRGRVLDIGPGTGFQLKRFTSAAPQIERIYGVEPSVEMHAQLSAEADTLLGKGKYVVLNCGAQPGQLVPVLAREWLLRSEQSHAQRAQSLKKKTRGGRTTANAAGEEDEDGGGFDTIVSIRALCGIPEPQETVRLFYRLLRPGGTLIFFEHVVNSGRREKGGSALARALQHVYMYLGWKFLDGGCELTRDTERYLMDAAKGDGGWAAKEIHHRNAAGCIPEIYGFVQKRK